MPPGASSRRFETTSRSSRRICGPKERKLEAGERSGGEAASDTRLTVCFYLQSDDPAYAQVHPDGAEDVHGEQESVSLQPGVELIDLDCRALRGDEVGSQRDLGRQEHEQIKANDEAERLS